MNLASPIRNEPNPSLERPALLTRTSNQSRAQDDHTLKADLLDILLDLTLHAGVGKVRVFVGAGRGDQHADLSAGFVRGLGQLDIQPMLDFVLVLEPACGCSCGPEGGKEDAGGWCEGGELAGPGGGITRDEVGEFGWGSAASGWGSAAGECVDAGYSGVGNKAGEDMGALSLRDLAQVQAWYVWEACGRVD